MTTERVELARVILPPNEEHCYAGLCGQKACCTVEARVEPEHWDDPAEEEAYVLPLCEAHALHVMAGVFDVAKSLFPPDEVDLPPWERDE